MKHSWQEKLDERGLKFVEMAAKLKRIRPPATLDMSRWIRWIKEQKDVLSSGPDLEQKRKVKLNPEFVRLLRRANPDLELNDEEMLRLFENVEFPLLRADELELHQRIFLALEADQDMRFEAYGAVASAIVLLRLLFSGGMKKQLGTKRPNFFQRLTAIAQNLEWMGGALRGDLKEPPGRVNVELAGLADEILEHQKDPLTHLELYAALSAAGAELPEDPEAFRLWLHRARKQGLVKNFRSRRTKPKD
jgi:hypothetical protein